MKSLAFFIPLVIFSLYSCSSKIFYISAKPEGSLIRHQEYYGYSNVAEVGPEEIPYKVVFLGKSSKTSFAAMKRGYYEDTIWVTRESPQKVSFALEKVTGAENYIDFKTLLTSADLTIFPPQIDVILHKGIGNMARYEKSETQSVEVSRNILSILRNEFTDMKKSRQLIIADPMNPSDTLRIPEQIMKYLLSVKPDLLKYYSIPPSLNKFNNWRNSLYGSDGASIISDTTSFLVLIYGKTIKPTTGRIIGNAAASVASGAVSGYQRATYGTSTIVYDPNAFSFDSSTLLMIYYINPDSGEILEVKQISFPFEIINPENQKKFVTELSKIINDI